MIKDMELNERQLQIKKWVDKIDQVAISYEAKWGIGKLPELITDELKAKWRTQNERFNDAIGRQDLRDIQNLCEGTIRAWSALEQNAIANGHKPHDAEYWEIKGDFTYRIYKTHIDARQPSPKGTVSYSLQEVANILQDYQLVNKVKETVGGVLVNVAPKVMDKSKRYEVEEDEIPF